MRVLVGDDDAISAEMLRNSLEQFEYDVTLAYDGVEAFSLMTKLKEAAGGNLK